MKNKIIFLIIVLYFLVGYSSAKQYEYLGTNEGNFMYLFSSINSSIPFLEYDHLSRCAKEVNINIHLLKMNCHERYLFNIINYLIENNGSKLIFMPDLSVEEVEQLELFAEKLNIQIISYEDISEDFFKDTSSIIIVGHKNLLSYSSLMNKELLIGEYLISVQEENDTARIGILGYDAAEIIMAIELLDKTYNEYFNLSQNECVIVEGCDFDLGFGEVDENSDGVISLNELVSYIQKWISGEAELNELTKAIIDWITGESESSATGSTETRPENKPSTGLIAYYTFDNDATTKVFDISGETNDGSILSNAGSVVYV